MAAIPMFPLQVAMLPGEELPLRIFEPRYTALVRDCLATDDPAFGVVLIEAGREVGGGDTRSNVGAMAHITDVADFGDGRYRLKCVMGERIRVLEWQPDDPYPRAAVEVWPDEPGAAVAVDAIREIEDRMVALFERIAAARGAQVDPREVVAGADESGDAGKWLYALAARLPMGQADRYAVLAAPSPAERLEALREGLEGSSQPVRRALTNDVSGVEASGSPTAQRP
jgi:Lon protease-like protein